MQTAGRKQQTQLLEVGKQAWAFERKRWERDGNSSLPSWNLPEEVQQHPEKATENKALTSLKNPRLFLKSQVLWYSPGEQPRPEQPPQQPGKHHFSLQSHESPTLLCWGESENSAHPLQTSRLPGVGAEEQS